MAERKGFDPLWGRPQTVFRAFMPMMRDRNADTVNAIRRNAETVKAIRRNADTVNTIRRNAETVNAM